MVLAILAFALLSQNVHAATSCSTVLAREVSPHISTLKVENKDNYYVGANLVQIKSLNKDEALFAATGQFGMSLVKVDLKNKAIEATHELGDIHLRSTGHSRMAVAADGKAVAFVDGSYITIFEPTKKGFKKVASADFSEHEYDFSPWTPSYYVHKDRVFKLLWNSASSYTQNSYVVVVGRGKSTNEFVKVAKTVGKTPEMLSDGYKNYSYDTQKRRLDVLDPITGEVTTHKFGANKGLRFDEFEINKAESLEDGSLLLTGYLGWIRLDAKMKLVNQDTYRDSSDRDSQAILWNIDKSSDTRGNKFAFPSEDFSRRDANYRSTNQAVQIIDTVTGEVKTISVPDVKRVFLNKDGSIVLETLSAIKILNEEGKEIKSFKLPNDGYPNAHYGDLSRIDDHNYVYTSTGGKSLLIEL